MYHSVLLYTFPWQRHAVLVTKSSGRKAEIVKYENVSYLILWNTLALQYSVFRIKQSSPRCSVSGAVVICQGGVENTDSSLTAAICLHLR